jgi:archaeosine-15-forming tRNA-guanine transglycosylase
MSIATEGTEGFQDREVPALTDASEFRDIPLEGSVKSTDFQADSFETPTTKHDQLVARTEAIVSTDGQVVGVTETQETAARTYNAFTTYAIAGADGTYAGDPVLLVGDDSRRARVLISNGHAEQSIVVGPLSSIQAGVGFVLPPFNTFDPQVQGAIYACVPAQVAAQNVPIGVWVEVNA